jgi:hypothetical protein
MIEYPAREMNWGLEKDQVQMGVDPLTPAGCLICLESILERSGIEW